MTDHPPLSIQISRYLALVELFLILLPLTLVALWATALTLPAGILSMLESPSNMPVLLLGLFCGVGSVSLMLGAVLMFRFVRYGRSALLSAPRVEWLASFVGAGLAVIGALLVVSGEGIAFAIALPALLPLAHMCYEYRQAMGDIRPTP